MQKTKTNPPIQSDLSGMVLIATPGMSDPRFDRSVVFLCSYSKDGAMGIIINQLADEPDFDSIATQLGVTELKNDSPVEVHVGGPVESGRGFILHSSDYIQDGTLVIGSEFALSATVDIVRSIADGEGPEQFIFALGYSGWAPGQLDREIQANGWLLADGTQDLVFDLDHQSKWIKALHSIGIDPVSLSHHAGRA